MNVTNQNVIQVRKKLCLCYRSLNFVFKLFILLLHGTKKIFIKGFRSFFIKDFIKEIRSFLRTLSHLLKMALMENIFFVQCCVT